ncbi:hypothetical protein AYO21_00558 [Fonsecaea monophora]|uniref:Beta-lactamase-related domain-containing protein n=1 Tax=Fonsecaea monophora TaxID=254056 RepID=A0A177FNP8_9EURO|nr:hypothetical protein AYO21_00558 [Fonsecaea monophora]OAG45210.1 hypothetical protein AYO21_00558 [Fonsecaea monophora]
MAQVDGFCDPRFEKVRKAFQEELDTGNELGASIAVNLKGENVVDIWGGHLDQTRTQPWNRDTIVNIWSSGKTIASLAGLVQVDRGQLDVDEKVSKYWPEFAANGKENVLVRHFLSHTSGVSGFESPITWDEIYDFPKSTAHLARQSPWWEPGTASGYHGINMGHLIGELVRRTSGKSMKDFVAEEIAGPLGADFQIGALEQDWPRISPLVPPPPLDLDFSAMDQNSVAVKTFTAPPFDALNAHKPEWRKADIAAVNGHGNARSVARILSVITLGGTVDGVKLLSPQTIDLIFRQQADGEDLVLLIPLRWGIGYCLTGGGTAKTLPHCPQGKICFWGGWGGSLGYMDLDRGLTFSYVMNRMAEGTMQSARTEKYFRAVYEALGVILP